MPVLLDRGSLGCRLFTAEPQIRASEPPRFRREDPNCIDVGLLNNMSDLALEQTERQILKLLDAAADHFIVRLRLYSLPDVPRGELGRKHLNRLNYYSVGDLWNSKLDGLIVTGAEPRSDDLRQEPYWHTLTKVFDWADENTSSTIASCLAVHAAVNHFDGVQRHSLAQKCFGIFEFEKIANDPLVNGVAYRLSMPHSRWNEIQESALTSCGYRILASSYDIGVDMFIKSKKALFIFFQGHPEYEAWTLLGEYRRDIGRFLTGERQTYPVMPRGYFREESARALNAFQDRAIANPHKELMASFPSERLTGKLTDQWRSTAVQIFSNWLLQMARPKTERSRPVRSIAITTMPSARQSGT
jgi:homoserine O-succinyltransferase/O-acetyltransferase